MKKRFFVTSGIVVSVGLALTLGVSSLAQAQAADTPSVITRGTQSFYTDAGVQQAWTELTQHYPDAMPAGAQFPLRASFFNDEATGVPHRNLWEVGLEKEIAARYWRCAWLKEEVSEKTSGLSPADLTAAVSRVTQHLARYPALADISDGQYQDYQASVAVWAEQMKTSPEAAEIAVDCVGSDAQKVN